MELLTVPRPQGRASEALSYPQLCLWYDAVCDSDRGGPMSEYLLYLFEGPRLVACDTFFAPDDEAAIEGAKTRCDGKAAELWQGSRKVKVFNNHPDINRGTPN